MAAVVFLICVLVLGAVTALLLSATSQATERRQTQQERWCALLQQLGLQVTVVERNHVTGQARLEGSAVHTEVKVDYAQRGHMPWNPVNQQFGAQRTAVVRSTLVASNRAVPRGLRLRWDEPWAQPLVEESEHSCGDPRFDGRVRLESLDAYACAALSLAARDLLAPLLEQGCRVEDGKVLVEWTTPLTIWSEEAEALPPVQEQLRSALEVTRALSVTAEQLPQRLAHNALHDPSRKLRLLNLRFLVAPATQASPQLLASTARALLAEPHQPIRLLAAAQLGAEGHGVLRALAADSQVEHDLRLQAVQALGASREPDLAGLKALLQSPHPAAVHCAALAALPPSARALHEAVVSLTRSEEDSVRAAAARALGVLALPATEPVLLGLLADDSSHVQQAAAQALGVFASVAAVEHLLPLAQALFDTQLRQAAREAVARIQARLGDVEAGRVSLAEPHELAGAVALAEDAGVRAGELTLSELEDEATGHALRSAGLR
jgi:hypothetical protein